MLRSFSARGFKSLADVHVDLPRFSVFFGPNAAGKSNLIDAIQAFSGLATRRTINDALEPIRGFPIEAFSFPKGGLPEFLKRPTAEFRLSADFETEWDVAAALPLTRSSTTFRYSVTARIVPASGSLTVQDERLAVLEDDMRGGRVAVGVPLDDLEEAAVRPGRERSQNRTLLSELSDELVSGVRSELSRWRAYYLDPRAAMRQAGAPTESTDIGTTGSLLAPYLYSLQQQQPNAFRQLQRVVRSVIPAVGEISVDLDTRRGTLDIQVEQGGTLYSSRVISEGTLRVLALCALAVNPEPPTLIAYEEPENGVHPVRLELVAKLLMSIAERERGQVLVTTHSPQFASTVLRLGRQEDADVGLFTVSMESGTTHVRRLEPSEPLLDDEDIRQALTAPDEGQVFEAMLRRGWLDE